MNWANVESIQWKEERDGRHTVYYKGSRSLPPPYIGEGGYSFTDEDFRKVYLELRNEERKGISITRAGYVITKPKPRTIGGLGQVARYFADEAFERVKDLEDRMKELEAIVATVTKDDDVIFKTAMKGNGDGTRQDGEEK